MNLPLYQSWLFESPLPAAALAAALRKATEERKFVPIRKPFVGRVSENRFTITKWIEHGNPFFHPTLRGRLVSLEGGTTVKVRVYPHPFALLCWIPNILFWNYVVIGLLLTGSCFPAMVVGLVVVPITVSIFAGFVRGAAESKSLLKAAIDSASLG